MPASKHLTEWNKSQNDRLRRAVQELQDRREAFVKTAEDLLSGVIVSMETDEVFVIDSIDIERLDTSLMIGAEPDSLMGRVRVTTKPIL